MALPAASEMLARSIPGTSDGSHSYAPMMLGFAISLTTLAFMVVVARLCVRGFIVRSLGYDDYASSLGMLISLGGLGIVIPGVKYGAGKHLTDINPLDISTGLHLNFAAQGLYIWASATVKVSIGLFLIRLAPNTIYSKITWGILAFLVAYTVTFFTCLLTQCKDIAVFWDPTVKTTCLPGDVVLGLGQANNAFNVITDVLLATMPIPILWNLQMNRRTKIFISGILGLGAFACVAAIVKAVYLPIYITSKDWLYDSAKLTICSVVECNIGIIAGSLPSLRPLVKKILESTHGSGSRRNTYSLQNYNRSTPKKKSLGSDLDETTIPHHPKDNISEESIAPLQGNGITKVTEISVDRAARRGGQKPVQIWERNDPGSKREVEDRV